MLWIVGSLIIAAVLVSAVWLVRAPLYLECPYCGGVGSYWSDHRECVCSECDGTGNAIRVDAAPESGTLQSKANR